MIFLLPVSFIIIMLIRLAQAKELTRALLDSFVICSAYTILLCEVLSLFTAYNTVTVSVAWILFCAASVFLFRHRFKETRGFFRDLRLLTLKRHAFELAVAAAIVAICILALERCLIYPPVNYDSMTFSLERTVHWYKNQSVDFYATNLRSQYISYPGASYMFLQSRTLMGGSDYFVNLVQFFGFIGAIIAIVGICRSLGLNSKLQALAALLASTMPIAVMQASTTQNDLLPATYALIVIYYITSFIKNPIRGKKEMDLWAVLTGFSCGIAFFIKQIGGVVLVPFALYFILSIMRRVPPKSTLKICTIVMLCALSMPFGFFIRNATHFNGDFLGISHYVTDAEFTARGGVRVRTVGMVKNIMYTFVSNNSRVANTTLRAAHGIANALSVDIEDPNITLYPNTYITFNWIYSHDTSGFPFHALIVLVSFLFAVPLAVAQKKWSYLGYAAAAAGAILICAFSFKWCTSAGRYMMASFLCAIPVVALTLDMLLGKWLCTQTNQLIEKKERNRSINILAFLLCITGTVIVCIILAFNLKQDIVFFLCAIPVFVLTIYISLTGKIQLKHVSITQPSILLRTLGVAVLCFISALSLTQGYAASVYAYHMPLKFSSHERARNYAISNEGTYEILRSFPVDFGWHSPSANIYALVQENNITQIGFENVVQHAVYPFTWRYTDARYTLRPVNPIHMVHKDDPDFLPEIIMRMLPAAPASEYPNAYHFRGRDYYMVLEPYALHGVWTAEGLPVGGAIIAYLWSELH